MKRMQSEQMLRMALWTAAVFNLGGVYLFGYPASPLGQLAGLPADVPLVYRSFVALFVLLFAGAYVWLATQGTINRPFVAFGAVGKASAFVLVLLLWLLDAATVRSVAVTSGDLALAVIFLVCLRGTKPAAAAR